MNRTCGSLEKLKVEPGIGESGVEESLVVGD